MINWLQHISQNHQVPYILLNLIRNNIDIQSAVDQLQLMGAPAMSEACGMMPALASSNPDTIPILEQLSQIICQDISQQNISQEEASFQEPVPDEITE